MYNVEYLHIDVLSLKNLGVIICLRKIHHFIISVE